MFCKLLILGLVDIHLRQTLRLTAFSPWSELKKSLGGALAIARPFVCERANPALQPLRFHGDHSGVVEGMSQH